jgi:hypothetical protein
MKVWNGFMSLGFYNKAEKCLSNCATISVLRKTPLHVPDYM